MNRASAGIINLRSILKGNSRYDSLENSVKRNFGFTNLITGGMDANERGKEGNKDKKTRTKDNRCEPGHTWGKKGRGITQILTTRKGPGGKRKRAE